MAGADGFEGAASSELLKALRRELHEILDDQGNVSDRLTRLEARSEGRAEMIEEKLGAMRAAILSEIDRKFSELKDELRSMHHEQLVDWQERDLPGLVDRIVTERQDAIFDSLKKWGGRAAVAVVLFMAISGQLSLAALLALAGIG